MKCFTCIVAFIAVSATALPSKSLDQLFYKSAFDAACIKQHCSGPADMCITEPKCVIAAGCSLECVAGFPEDPSPQKYKALNCTNNCAFTYDGGDAFPMLMGCITDNNCITLPAIPSTCKSATVKPIKPLSTKDLEGRWWVVRGYHQVYDCYPCHSEMIHANGSSVMFQTSYDAYLTNGGTKHVMTQEQWPMTQPGEGIKYTYRDFGIMFNEERWPLDKADDNSWIIVYICGNSFNWYYEGAQVLSKEKTLNSAAMAQIAASYKQAVGLDLQQFCTVRNSGSTCQG